MDISRGGLCIFTNLRLPTDAKANIRLWLFKNKEPLALKGRVAWMKVLSISAKTEKYKVGLEFLGIKNKDKLAITRFLRDFPGKA